LCYAIVSLWVFVAAPWLFIKLRLAGVNADNSTGQSDSTEQSNSIEQSNSTEQNDKQQ